LQASTAAFTDLLVIHASKCDLFPLMKAFNRGNVTALLLEDSDPPTPAANPAVAPEGDELIVKGL
jgi:hypothetical protein